MTRLTNLVVPLGGLLFAATFVAFTYDLPIQSRVFPFTAAALVAVFGVVLLVQNCRAVTADRGPPAQASKAPLTYDLALAFVAGFATVGFLAASAIYIFVAQYLLGERWKQALAIAVGLTTAYYVCFRLLLGVQL
jgi:hypothetical protein